MRAAVGRAEQRRRTGPGKDDVGVDRIDRDPPDIEVVHRRWEVLEALPAVDALVDAVIGPGKDGARLVRMDGQLEHPAFAPQALADAPPASAAVGAEPGAAANRSDADREIARHGRCLP